MPADLWTKLHGGSVHFPIALLVAGTALDVAAVLRWETRLGQQAAVAGRYLMVLGAIGGIPAVISGLFLSKGQVWGADALRWHHLFVWPAFTLMAAVAGWRAGVKTWPRRRDYAMCAGVELLLSALVMAAGYWGGEMLISAS